MRIYTIILDEATADFFEAVAHYTKQSPEKIISDALIRVVKMTNRRVFED